VFTDELNRVLTAALKDTSVFGIRDALIISLVYGFGFRDRQLASLAHEDYIQESGELRTDLPHQSELHLSPAARFPLDRWIKVRGDAGGWLINPIRRPARITLAHFRRSSLEYVFKRRIREAGVKPFSLDDIARSHSLITRGTWD